MNDPDNHSTAAAAVPTAEPSISYALDKYLSLVRDRALAYKAEVTMVLIGLGIARLEINYDGCGDSGQIEEVSFWNMEGESVTPSLDKRTADRVHQFCYDLLEVRHGGWENDDGAYGTFEWDLKSDELIHTHHTRYTEVDTTVQEGL
ncbi:MAG: DUF6878 family protein [Steroidobacteraceae bacterium]